MTEENGRSHRIQWDSLLLQITMRSIDMNEFSQHYSPKELRALARRDFLARSLEEYL
jgi:hypothetical protein